MTSRRWALLAGAVDGVVFYMGVIALWVFSGVEPMARAEKVLGLFWRETVFVLGPAAVLVGWRGCADAVRVASGRRSWLRLPLEGFLAGVAIVVALFVIGATSAVWAAGGVFDDVSMWGLSDWLLVVGMHGHMAGLLGSLGAASGVVLTVINRLLLRLVGPSNIGMQPAAFGRG